jgi:L-fuconolactonase
MIRVDAHHHVWRVGRGDYGWLTPDLPIYRDYRLPDLRPLLGDISGTVLVQAAPTEAETAYLLNVARNSDGLVRAVVGWEDLSGRKAPERIESLAADPHLRGIRPMLQDISETEWILDRALEPALRAMLGCSLRFDALIQPRHLRTLLTFCERHPEIPVVIDHAAKPDIAHGAFQPWAEEIGRIARETQAFCKLSGLVTEAGKDWHVDDLRRYTEHLLSCFGPDRLMWGSDWPVVELAGGYIAWRQATDRLLAALDEASRDAVMGGTAVRFYGLNSERRSQTA